MGLDNGITLRLRKDRFTEKEIATLNKFNDNTYVVEDENTFDIDLLYWRKCWNIRGEIFDFLRKKGHTVDGDIYEYDLSIDEIFDLTKALRKILNPHWWDENGNSIWTWKECGKNYIDNVKRCVKALNVLKKMNKSEDSYRIYFYDSY